VVYNSAGGDRRKTVRDADEQEAQHETRENRNVDPLFKYEFER
jgi:hypothetical protein